MNKPLSGLKNEPVLHGDNGATRKATPVLAMLKAGCQEIDRPHTA